MTIQHVSQMSRRVAVQWMVRFGLREYKPRMPAPALAARVDQLGGLDRAGAKVDTDRRDFLAGPSHRVHPPPCAADTRSNSGRNMLMAMKPTITPSTMRIAGSMMLVSDLTTMSFSSSRKSAI